MNYQCGTLTVPHDWFASGGTPIQLAVIRLPAAGHHPIGSLLVNPGGPGEPGVEFLRNFFSYGELPPEILKNFDIVSWDPRGTGNSDGIACLSTADFLEAEPLPYPPTQAERAKVAAKDTAQTNHCLATEGDTMPFVGTRETVHDLDALKTALGDQKLTYLGFSYGTAIGLEYLKEFPTHVRAMVLDGIDLPSTDPTSTAYAQVASFEHNLDAFLADCKADRSCEFGGGDPRGALTAFLNELATGKRIPASYAQQDESGTTHNRIGTLGYTEALEGIIATLYNQKSWPALRGALVEATAKPADGKQLLSFRDQLLGRQPDGTWNHSQEANMSISCADQVARATSDFGDPKRIVEWKAKLPFFGAFGAVGQPGCYRIPDALVSAEGAHEGRAGCRAAGAAGEQPARPGHAIPEREGRAGAPARRPARHLGRRGPHVGREQPRLHRQRNLALPRDDNDAQARAVLSGQVTGQDHSGARVRRPSAAQAGPGPRRNP